MTRHTLILLCLLSLLLLTGCRKLELLHGEEERPIEAPWLLKLDIYVDSDAGSRGEVRITVETMLGIWIGIGFPGNISMSLNGSGIMDNTYAIIISGVADSRKVEERLLSNAGEGDLIRQLTTAIDEVDNGRRLINMTIPTVRPYFTFGSTPSVITVISASGTGRPDSSVFAAHGPSRGTFTVHLKDPPLSPILQERVDDGNCTLKKDKAECENTGCYYEGNTCKDCRGIPRSKSDFCQHQNGCFFDTALRKCKPRCSTIAHSQAFGICVPHHWEIDRKDDFTWFEKSCPKHISNETKAQLLAFQAVKNFGLVSHEDDHTLDHEIQHDSRPWNVLVIFGTFAMGAFVRYLCLGTKVPYTVVMFLVGMGYGALNKIPGAASTMDKYEQLANMNPHMIFYIFLPVLIFESAFAMEMHVFKKVMGQCLILAVPGLMISSLLTGLVAKYTFTEYDWTLPACLLFGTILSATDPVAVVALLKELGASKLISTMIEGESLFNDGTAIVFFTVLKSSVERGEGGGCTPQFDTCGDQCTCIPECSIPYNIAEIFLQFCIVSLGGPAVGFVIAVITVFCLNRVFNDGLIEITVTLTSAYITFFVCEGLLHVSGVLGLVVLGCYMSYFRQCISPEVEHYLHEFWEMTVYLTNTCIFALAGMIVVMKALNNITGADIGYLGIIYVTINIVRALVVGIFAVLMKFSCFEYKLDVGNTILVAWGGLRGAVGLALALIIEADDRVVVPLVREKFIFHVAGIVILTLCVNGVTTQYIVVYFGLSKIEDRRKKLMRDRFEELQAYRKEDIRSLGWNEMTASAYYDCNWELVYRYTDIETELSDKHQNPYMLKGERCFDKCDEKYEEKSWEEGRCAYYNAIQGCIHSQYAQGQLGPDAVRDLHHLVIVSQERDESGLLDPADLKQFFEPSRFSSLTGTGSQQRLVQALDICLGFVACHTYAKARIRPVCETHVASRIETHCKRAITQTGHLINIYTDSAATISTSIKTKHTSRSVLNGMKLIVADMHAEGRLDDQDRAELVSMIELRMKNLQQKFPSKLNLPDDESALEMAPWFQRIDESGQNILRTLFLGSGMIIPEKVSVNSPEGLGGLYFLVSGIVEIRLGRKIFRYGASYTLGLQSLLTESSRFDDIVTSSACHVIFLKANKITAAMKSNPSIAESLWQECGVQAARILMALEPQFEKWSTSEIRKYAVSGSGAQIQEVDSEWDSIRTHKLKPETQYSILLRGVCFEYEGQDKIKFPAMIPSTYKFASFSNRAYLFQIEAPDNASTRSRRRWGRLRQKVKSIVLWSSLRSPYWGRVSLSLAFGVEAPSGVKRASRFIEKPVKPDEDVKSVVSSDPSSGKKKKVKKSPPIPPPRSVSDFDTISSLVAQRQTLKFSPASRSSSLSPLTKVINPLQWNSSDSSDSFLPFSEKKRISPSETARLAKVKEMESQTASLKKKIAALEAARESQPHALPQRKKIPEDDQRSHSSFQNSPTAGGTSGGQSPTYKHNFPVVPANTFFAGGKKMITIPEVTPRHTFSQPGMSGEQQKPPPPPQLTSGKRKPPPPPSSEASSRSVRQSPSSSKGYVFSSGKV